MGNICLELFYKLGQVVQEEMWFKKKIFMPDKDQSQ